MCHLLLIVNCEAVYEVNFEGCKTTKQSTVTTPISTSTEIKSDEITTSAEMPKPVPEQFNFTTVANVVTVLIGIVICIIFFVCGYFCYNKNCTNFAHFSFLQWRNFVLQMDQKVMINHQKTDKQMMT